MQAQPTSGTAVMQLILFWAIIFAVFYVFLILPQRRREQERAKMLAKLKNGDWVVTVGGIRGKITQVSKDGKFVKLEIADGVEIQVLKSAISHIEK